MGVNVEEPSDADERRACTPVLVYPVGSLPLPDMDLLYQLRTNMVKVDEVLVQPRSASCFKVPKGYFCKIICPEGYQVGDLNLWNTKNLKEKFYSGKTRAINGTHVRLGQQLWSSFPYLRPMATITYDSLEWYGIDRDGGSVHDVIGTRCDPYTNKLLTGQDYHHCCHSNLVEALAAEVNISKEEAEQHVHDVLNVFMCTGFTRDTQQYFMKASPVRGGDTFELFAEIDLLGALSACPGGDCGSSHSSDVAQCHPLLVEIWKPNTAAGNSGWTEPEPSKFKLR